jgi:murein DD-endopeptidase
MPINQISFAMILAAGLVIAAPVTAQVQHSFDLRVPTAPRPVNVAGRIQLVYELHLTSFAPVPLRIQGLSIIEQRSGRSITALRGPALDSASSDSVVVAPGNHAVIFIELELEPNQPLPAELAHELEYGDGGTTTTIRGAAVAVAMAEPLVLGPPLRGGPWAAVYHPAWLRGHRRVFYTVDGLARLPGRFAIDWIKLDSAGRTTIGDPDSVANWLGQGAEVLAVTDAVVAAVRDDVAESELISTHRRLPLEDATGNYVALDVGEGRYVFYEHLKPGSVRVKAGQRVRRGDVIAALGFTGHSTGPHLHLHVADTNSPLGAEGLPFVLERFELIDGGARSRERPAPNVVVQFP